MKAGRREREVSRSREISVSFQEAYLLNLSQSECLDGPLRGLARISGELAWVGFEMGSWCLSISGNLQGLNGVCLHIVTHGCSSSSRVGFVGVGYQEEVDVEEDQCFSSCSADHAGPVG